MTKKIILPTTRILTKSFAVISNHKIIDQTSKCHAGFKVFFNNGVPSETRSQVGSRELVDGGEGAYAFMLCLESDDSTSGCSGCETNFL